MNELTLSTLLKHIQRMLDDFLPLQIVDPKHSEMGAVLSPEAGMTYPWQAEKLIKLIVYQTLVSGDLDEALIKRAISAADH